MRIIGQIAFDKQPTWNNGTVCTETMSSGKPFQICSAFGEFDPYVHSYSLDLHKNCEKMYSNPPGEITSYHSRYCTREPKGFSNAQNT